MAHRPIVQVAVVLEHIPGQIARVRLVVLAEVAMGVLEVETILAQQAQQTRVVAVVVQHTKTTLRQLAVPVVPVSSSFVT